MKINVYSGKMFAWVSIELQMVSQTTGFGSYFLCVGNMSHMCMQYNNWFQTFQKYSKCPFPYLLLPSLTIYMQVYIRLRTAVIVHCLKSYPNFRDITRNVEENEILHEIFRIVSRFPRYILENWDSVDKVYNLIYNIQHTVKNLLQIVILRGCIAQK